MQSLQAWEYPDSWNVADMHMRMFSKLATIALALTTLLILRTDFGKSRHGLVTAFVVLIASLIISTFAYGTITHEQRAENLRFLLGIRRPEETTKRVLQFMAFFICFIAPVLIFLRIGSKYVLLDERLYYQLVYPLATFVLASFLIPALNRCLNDYPRWMSLAARVGFCIPALAAVFSVALTLNCVKDNSERARDLPCLAKRKTLGSNPTYYLLIRPWENTDREVEVEVSKQVFVATPPGTELRITTGLGRLGVEWIRRIDAVQEAPQKN